MIRVLPSLAVVCALCLTACGAGDDGQWSPEVVHCAGIAGLATQTYGEISVKDVKEEVLGETKNVRLKFAYPESMEDFTTGQIKCGYAFGADLAGNPERAPKAVEVYFKGRYLSEDELFYVNSSLFKPRPLFKLND